MDIQPQHFRSPQLYGDFWYNSGPVSIGDLRGNVVLVDFWDYTSVNCIRALPYVKEWQLKYAEYGLVVVGVHTPEFKFAREQNNVEQAIKKSCIDYPVVSDNEARIWSAFGCRTWPTKFLIDKDGFIRVMYQGEGGYEQFERAIQFLISDAGIHGNLPDIMEPIRETDIPGTVCYKVAGEVQTGYLRGAIGNVEGFSPESTLEYVDQGIYMPGRFYAEGKWNSGREFIRFNGSPGEEGHINLRYEAAEVNAVLRTEDGKKAKIKVRQDGMWLASEYRGTDIHVAKDGSTFVLVDRPRMFNIVRNREFGEHLLRLTMDSSEVQLYAFSFVTSPIPDVIPAN